jgi:hypothetical protein
MYVCITPEVVKRLDGTVTGSRSIVGYYISSITALGSALIVSG